MKLKLIAAALLASATAHAHLIQLTPGGFSECPLTQRELNAYRESTFGQHLFDQAVIGVFVCHLSRRHTSIDGWTSLGIIRWRHLFYDRPFRARHGLRPLSHGT